MALVYGDINLTLNIVQNRAMCCFLCVVKYTPFGRSGEGNGMGTKPNQTMVMRWATLRKNIMYAYKKNYQTHNMVGIFKVFSKFQDLVLFHKGTSFEVPFKHSL